MPFGELDLAAGAGPGLFQQREDPRGQDVSPDDGLLRRRVLELWLLDHTGAGVDPRIFDSADPASTP